MDADSLPVVIPFAHTGMQDIMPVGKRTPRAGKQVSGPILLNAIKKNICGTLHYLFDFLGDCGCG